MNLSLCQWQIVIITQVFSKCQSFNHQLCFRFLIFKKLFRVGKPQAPQILGFRRRWSNGVGRWISFEAEDFSCRGVRQNSCGLQRLINHESDIKIHRPQLQHVVVTRRQHPVQTWMIFDQLVRRRIGHPGQMRIRIFALYTCEQRCGSHNCTQCPQMNDQNSLLNQILLWALA